MSNSPKRWHPTNYSVSFPKQGSVSRLHVLWLSFHTSGEMRIRYVLWKDGDTTYIYMKHNTIKCKWYFCLRM